MSRIGKLPIAIPSGVDVKVDNNNVVTVKGSKGTLTKEFHKDMIIKVDGGFVTVQRPSDDKMHKALHGLTRTLINNMVEGVTKGYEKHLEIVGVGFRAVKQGKKLVLTLGYSHPVEMEEPAGITVEVPAPNKLVVKGIDKQAVGEFAAKIRSKREPEVYKGKGIRYEGEVVKLKEGKTGGKGKK
ncbi:50S ribosomal protein L6 [Clostridium thermosuccinogenes]|jgi:large subunit ribosomal protein L6|uniref:Large ribosomal subunit protein uL6 n=1 Tax=Clostridium thermosuccinogenes TaxID=84032 RepID=A0A2K2FCR0_9CLOT|nr:50S ribosomal protein L6 [Pseudoclostridium thermosuccinogenes]AUS98132.1 50S ribosomal protein L6 [Pseudoclostridium thermosuccinogenes]PNT91213.1 50S ribosomal protein L6 [Pseudoclostridium thermosuccinogenes]PNT95397.1 50S ribosomal protein L6 [Pseudoclostridium thermosuccinogenes]PNT96573.1 50S ribosomal protein L6 [Pseudoclostridium thermosuccinogenes]